MLSIKTVAVVLITFIQIACVIAGDVKCPKIFDSNMVLQRQKPVPIWGWAKPGGDVTVTFAGQSKTAKAYESGRWNVTLDSMEASAEDREMKIIAGGETVTFTNVLVGEVWLASGQSNMEWSLEKTTMPKDELAKLNKPLIRIIEAKRAKSETPRHDLNGKWGALDPNSAPSRSAVASYFAMKLHDELDVPIGILSSAVGGTKIEPWTPVEGFDLIPELSALADAARGKVQSPDADKKGSVPPSSYYNAMIGPMAGMAIRGAIWYQGESNVDDGLLYEKKMHALVGGWRKNWNQGDFPFYFVQIAPYRGYAGPRVAALWEAQLLASRSIKNSGMVVTTDIGEMNNVHPWNKKDVGHRLALWALAKDYPTAQLKAGGKAADLVYSGPLYKGHEIKDDAIRVFFEHAESGLAFKGTEITDVEVKGDGDDGFVKARPTIDGSVLVVKHPKGNKPLAVRMGWSKNPQPNLTNKEGLPASPFRTKE